jgi:hypothetical protein
MGVAFANTDNSNPHQGEFVILWNIALAASLFGAALPAADARSQTAEETSPDSATAAMAYPDVVLIAENTSIETPEGESVVLAPGEYRVEAAGNAALRLTQVEDGQSVLVAAQPVEPGADMPVGAWIVEHDGKPHIQLVGRGDAALRAALQTFEIVTRSIYIVTKPDLRIAISGPSLHESPVADTWTVTVSSNNAPASNVVFGFSLCTTTSIYGSSCWILESATGASCNRLATSNPAATGDAWRWRYDLRCTVSSIPANGSAVVRLRTNYGGISPANGWGSTWHFYPYVDPQRAISESNEYNNSASTSFTVHRKNDLVAQLDERCLVRDRNTTVTFRIHDPGSRTASGVRAILSTPGFNIGLAQPASTDSGFSCTFSNDPSRAICSNGRTGGSLGATDFRVSLRPKPSFPNGLTPVILQVDPDGRISESSETNNMVTKNFEIQRANPQGHCY